MEFFLIYFHEISRPEDVTFGSYSVESVGISYYECVKVSNPAYEALHHIFSSGVHSRGNFYQLGHLGYQKLIMYLLELRIALAGFGTLLSCD